MPDNIRIVIIGAGNLAWHLAKTFIAKNYKIVNIYSNSLDSAHKLAEMAGSVAVPEIHMIDDNADLYFIAVTDKAIGQVLESGFFNNKKVVHTAGSISMEVFVENIKHAGVFYPLQTFTRFRNIEFAEIPVFIEANNIWFENYLFEFAKNITNRVLKINSGQRMKIHLAAVFANNFVNYMLSLSKKMCIENNLDFGLLYPLISETALKAIQLGPEISQTGPARRNDIESIERHLELLSSKPELHDIYKVISKHICLAYNEL
jgi:predicted short-subunit dehydrogenase-like oxidoreductase (DUF2520 family)